MGRSLRVRAASIALVTAMLAGPAVAQPFNTNLVVNGDAEARVAADPDCAGPKIIPGWSTTANFTDCSYSTGGGFPTPGDPGSPTRGANFLAGGNAGTSMATQTIALSGITILVDSGAVMFDLSAWLGGYLADEDRAQVTATFRDSGGAPLATATIGPVTVGDRGFQTRFLLRATPGAVPPRSRSVDVAVTMTQISGYTDGYADDISLSLFLAAPQLDRNLVVNGDAEARVAEPDCNGPATIPGWSTTSTFTDCSYATGGGFPTPGDPGSPTRGANFFAGGSVGPSTATQTISLSGIANVIDQNVVIYDLAAWLGGFAAQPDYASVTANFRDAGGALIRTATIDPVFPDDRGQATGFVFRNRVGLVLPGTRSVDVVVTMDQFVPGYVDGYADDISLRLSVAARVFNANILLNGDAETRAAEPDCDGPATIPGWATGTNFTDCSYATGGGFPTPGDPGSPTRGANFFAGGGAGTSVALQSVSLEFVAAGRIDLGFVTYNLSGWLGGSGDEDDSAEVTATFRDSTGAILATRTIGPVDAMARAIQTGFLFQTATGVVPAGARRVQVGVRMKPAAGTYTDGYADDISLLLFEADGVFGDGFEDPES